MNITPLYSPKEIKENIRAILSSGGIPALKRFYDKGDVETISYYKNLLDVVDDIQIVKQEIIAYLQSTPGSDPLDDEVQRMLLKASRILYGVRVFTENQWQYGEFGFLDALVDTTPVDNNFIFGSAEYQPLARMSLTPFSIPLYIKTLPTLLDTARYLMKRSSNAVQHILNNILQDRYTSLVDLQEDLIEAKQYIAVFAVPFTNSSTLRYALDIIAENPEVYLKTITSYTGTSLPLKEEFDIEEEEEEYSDGDDEEYFNEVMGDIAERYGIKNSVMSGDLSLLLQLSIELPCSGKKFAEAYREFGEEGEEDDFLDALEVDGLLTSSTVSLKIAAKNNISFTEEEATTLDSALQTNPSADVIVIKPTSKLLSIIDELSEMEEEVEEYGDEESMGVEESLNYLKSIV
jgi:hypothetical protein